MEFKEALKILNIEDYGKRIFNSNSHGELFHLEQYVILAEIFEYNHPEKFREWFIKIVNLAEETWGRPESIFQHIYDILIEQSSGGFLKTKYNK